MNPAVVLERLLTAYFAEIGELTIDTDIFRGILPEDVCNAVGVFVNANETGNTPSMHRYSAQVLGRYFERDAAMGIAARLWTPLPHHSKDMVILKNGTNMFYRSRWNGREVWGVSLNLLASFR